MAGTLAGLQRAFQSHLTDGDPAVRELVQGPTRDQVDERLGVYRHAYTSRLEDVLRDDFHALAAHLGDEGFAKMSAAYVRAFPSVKPSVRWFGERLSTFLSSQAPWAADPAAGELAAFEWALTLAFDAQDTPPVTLERMAAFPQAAWPMARIRLHPSVQRLNFEFDVPAWWRSLVKDGAPPERPARSAAPWVIWRRETRPHFRRLETDEAWVMDSLRGHEPFGTVCEGLCQWHGEEDVAARFAVLLKGWILEEMVAGIISG